MHLFRYKSNLLKKYKTMLYKYIYKQMVELFYQDLMLTWLYMTRLGVFFSH